MATEDKIRIGLIGFGYWGPNIARNLLDSDFYELVSIADESELQRSRASKKFPSTNIVATANIDGRVTFFANGKVIPGCKNRNTSSRSVTCVWRPSVHGRNAVSANITSSTFSTYTGSFSSITQTTRRTGSR